MERSAIDDTEWQEVIDTVRRKERPRVSLEERVQALEDKEAIRDLIMTYGYLQDSRHRFKWIYPELLDLFTDDVERQLGGTLDERIVGKEALREVMERPRMDRKSWADTPKAADVIHFDQRHMTTSEVIRLSDDGKEAWVAATYTIALMKDGQRGGHDGTYVFGLRKVDGRWRIARTLLISTAAFNPMYQR